MTAKEEDILTSETLLKRGLAIDKLVESVLIDKSINPSTLLVGDKNALLIASRVTGFGPEYEAIVECPSCGKSTNKMFDLESVQTKDVDYSDVEVTETGTCIFQLPVSQVTVEIRLLTAGDETRISQTIANRKKNKLPETNSTLVLSSLIVSANGVDDRAQLSRLVEVLPLRDAKHLRSTYERVRPDVNMSFPFLCDACTHDGEVTMPLTADFFWPKQ
ncbi:MAG: hypothetical protein HN566_12575 [Polaribacter sp.]|jgi:hypothetical protein|nr:hypothetical protein [Polaribacter sp.]